MRYCVPIGGTCIQIVSKVDAFQQSLKRGKLHVIGLETAPGVARHRLALE